MTRTRLAVAFALLLAVLVLADLVGGPMNDLFLRFPGIDKVAHFSFHVVFFVVVRSLAVTILAGQSATWLAVAIGLVVAGGDELIQGFVATRNMEIEDFLADCAGLAFGWVLSQKPRRAVAVSVSAASFLVAATVTFQTHIRLRDYALGLQYERQQNFVQARVHYQQALQNGLHSPGLYNGLGWVEIESGVGDPGKAVEYSRTALEMRPGDADFLDTYGWALLHAGESGEALRVLEEAYRKKPKIYCINYHLGMAYRAVGRRDEAETHLQRQVELTRTRESKLARQALAEMKIPR